MVSSSICRVNIYGWSVSSRDLGGGEATRAARSTGSCVQTNIQGCSVTIHGQLILQRGSKFIFAWSFDCETLEAQAKRMSPQTVDGHADDHCQLAHFGSHARHGDFSVSRM